MPIELLVGATGAGKSFHAVKHYVLGNLEKGRRVVTNLPLNIEALQEKLGADLSELVHVVPDEDDAGFRWFQNVEHYEDEWQGASGQRCLFVIDEATDILSREKAKDPVREFFRKHRHRHHDIVLLAQDHTFIDPGVRKNVDTTIRLVSGQALGLSKKMYREDRFLGSSAGGNPREQRFHTYSDDVFKLYQSRTMGGGEGENADRIGHIPIWRRVPFLLAAASFVACVLLAVWLEPWKVIGFGRDNTPPFEPSGEPGEIVFTDGDGTGRRTGKREMVFVGSVGKGAHMRYLISFRGRRPRAVQGGDLRRLGLDLRSADGCAVWSVQGAGEPRLILCGDEL